MQFGVSTHLYHGERLNRDHLAEIAVHGFDRVEVFATKSHFDYHSPAAVRELAGWLRETRLTLHSMHAPIVESLSGGQWGATFSNALADEAGRQRAVRETLAALDVTRELPYSFLVVHLGMPQGKKPIAGDNDPGAARRSLEELHTAAALLGVRLAIEVIPNDLSTPDALLHLIEEADDPPGIGACLDFGHAFLMGDLLEAIETLSGHVLTTHVHDNSGTADEHLVPFDGGIDWSSALMSVRKIGYESALIFEVENTGSPPEILQKLQRVRARFEKMLGE